MQKIPHHTTNVRTGTAMFVGVGRPSTEGPTLRKNVRKYPGNAGKARNASSRGAPARITAPEITVMTPAHTALWTDVFIATLASPQDLPN
jgi:hypothetical protein